ncbi:hypothetical protein ACFYSF_48190 [Streptomyces canus]|uniref:hypothetical protein n=1 Tax=Streptomyces canus TaxID=58343 RepID=UPI0036B66619
MYRRHGVRLEGRVLVSLPTMLVAFARYSRDGSFAVLGANIRFTTIMGAGSIAGAVLGGLLLGMFPNLVPPTNAESVSNCVAAGGARPRSRPADRSG